MILNKDGLSAYISMNVLLCIFILILIKDFLCVSFSFLPGNTFINRKSSAH